MAIKEYCNTDVVICDSDTSIPEVAKLMRTHHVGDVIVVEHRNGRRIPTGIVTDRDIVLEAVAVELDVEVFTAGDLMTAPVVTVQAEDGVFETLQAMSKHRVRRIAVVDEHGALHGIISADDLVSLLSRKMAMLTDALVEQPVKESRTRR